MHLNTIFAPKAGWKVESMCVPLQTELWSRFGSKGNIIESLAPSLLEIILLFEIISYPGHFMPIHANSLSK